MPAGALQLQVGPGKCVNSLAPGPIATDLILADMTPESIEKEKETLAVSVTAPGCRNEDDDEEKNRGSSKDRDTRGAMTHRPARELTSCGTSLVTSSLILWLTRESGWLVTTDSRRLIDLLPLVHLPV